MIKSKEKQKVKSNEEIGVKYMQAWEEKYYEREEGREEGSKFKLLEQIIKKLRKDKTPETIADELEEDEDTIQHPVSYTHLSCPVFGFSKDKSDL